MDDDWIRTFRLASDSEKEKIVNDDEAIRRTLLQISSGLEKEDADENYKINLLVFLEENASLLLCKKDRMESTCTMLNHALNTATQALIRSQLLVTLTNIMVVMEVIESESRTFESFVDFLFDIITKVNSSADRVMRATACECLRELEECYPGLLGSGLGHFFMFMQKEQTHASLSYTALFQIVLQHQLMILSSIQLLPYMGLSHNSLLPSLPSFPSDEAPTHMHTLFDTKDSLCPFVIPESFPHIRNLLSPEQTLGIIPFEYHVEIYVKDIRRAVQALADAGVRSMTRWGQFRTVLGLVCLVQACNLNGEVFRHRFQKFFTTDDLLQNHVVMLLLSQFTSFGVFQNSDVDDFVKRAFVIVDNFQLPWEQRFLLFDWLVHFRTVLPTLPANPGAPLTWSSSLSISNDASVVRFPLITDPLPIKEAKLCALVNSQQQEDEDEDATLMTKKPPAPPAVPTTHFLSALRCIKEYQYYTNTAKHVYSAFRVLSVYLTKKSLFEPTSKYLNKVISRAPSFTHNIITMINYFSAENGSKKTDEKMAETQEKDPQVAKREAHARIAHNLLMHFNDFLVSSQGWDGYKKKNKSASNGPHALSSGFNRGYYLDLIKRILEDSTVDPTALISSLQVLLRCSTICSQGHWRLGNSLLTIASVLLTTPRNRLNIIFKPLSELLAFVSVYYNNIDIRDRAHFFFMLLTHVPYEKIQPILSRDFSSAKSSASVSDRTENPSVGSTEATPDPNAGTMLRPTVREISLNILRITRVDPIFNNNCTEERSFCTVSEQIPTEEEARTGEENYLPEYLATVYSRSGPTRLENTENRKQKLNIRKSDEKVESLLAIRIQYTIKFDISETPKLDPNFLRLYSISVNFTESPLYSPIKPLHIPYLALSDRPLSPIAYTWDTLPSSPFTSNPPNPAPTPTPAPTSTSLPSTSVPSHAEDIARHPDAVPVQTDRSAPHYTTYPYEYVTTLYLTPVLALPIEFGVTGMFNDNTGNVYKSKMTPLKLRIQDLFLPVYVDKKTRKARDAYVSKLFESFWTFLETTTDPNFESNKSTVPSSLDNLTEPELHAKSVKFLEYTKHIVFQTINLTLKPFQVSPPLSLATSTLSTSSHGANKAVETATVVKFFIFLPKKYHLLLKMDVHDNFTNVTILTDYWRILTFMDEYFDGIFTLETQ